MKYMGGKSRHAKEILSIILKDKKADQWYVEPFCGSAVVIEKVIGNRIGSDINFQLIELFKAIQQGWQPPDIITEEQYYEIKNHGYKYSNALIAFAAIGCSYGGKWWGGYARGKNSNGEPRNYALESQNNLLKQKQGLDGIIFKSCDYTELEIPPNSLIYNDPPYFGTTKYKNKFDHIKFWQWCNQKVEQGHKVFVSEYIAPEDWQCVWQKEVNSSLTKETGSKKAIERLFTK